MISPTMRPGIQFGSGFCASASAKSGIGFGGGCRVHGVGALGPAGFSKLVDVASATTRSFPPCERCSCRTLVPAPSLRSVTVIALSLSSHARRNS